MSGGLKKYFEVLKQVNPIKLCGKVTEVIGMVIEADGPVASIGDVCSITYHRGGEPVKAEVVGFRGDKVLLMPFGEMRGIAVGSRIVSSGGPLLIKVGDELLGRVIDSFGNPLDDKGRIFCSHRCQVYGKAAHPLKRTRIQKSFSTGIKAIDALLTCGTGQRIGIFSGSGIGKSTLLGMVARYSEADVVVVGLIGERGREVRDFIEQNLGEAGLKKSVVVVATSDQSPLVRINGALAAASIAEYFRDRNKKVLLLVDSVTRLAMAQREVGLAIGEPPTTKGYTPSVFSMLPKLLERAGTSETGSITGFYTVLVEADDMNEPIADTARSILDGHIVLSRQLADSGHYPPIDILKSISRLMIDVVKREQFQASLEIKDMLAAYRNAEDLINIGAYHEGSNPKVDRARLAMNRISDFLRQPIDQSCAQDQSIRELADIVQAYPVMPAAQNEPQEGELSLKNEEL
jgi:flagellum-specific ATP synthase